MLCKSAGDWSIGEGKAVWLSSSLSGPAPGPAVGDCGLAVKCRNVLARS